MSDREDFLSRWSRRKRDAGKESASPEGENKPTQADEFAPEAGETTPAEQASIASPLQGAEEEAKDEPAFDLSKLPSLESITAETDIRPFMAAGVPVSLRQAALRRVWVADPKIRDFIGIAENQWDFTPGGDAPGFDFSPPTGDIKRLVAEIFGGGERAQPGESVSSEEKLSEREEPKSVRRTDVETESAADQLDVKSSGQDSETSGESGAREAPQTDAVATGTQRDDVASQYNDTRQSENFRVARRTHGGAMPK